MVFELFQKLHLQIYANQCMTSLIIPLPFVLLNLESVERKRIKTQISEYLENEKSFLDEINHIFHSFWKATAWKESKYGVFSGPYFSIFRLNTEIYGVNLHIQFKHGKILTRKNPILETFCIVEIFDSFLIHERISLNPWPSNFGSSQNGLLGSTFFFIYVIFASDANLDVLVTECWFLCACMGSCVSVV